MHLTTILTLLFLTTTLAAPIPQSAPAGAPTTTTHLYICADASFRGNCTNLQLQVSSCLNMQPSYMHQVSSAGPDEGTFCTLYSEPDCHGTALPFTFPGIRALGRYGYDDTLSSVRCDLSPGGRTTRDKERLCVERQELEVNRTQQPSQDSETFELCIHNLLPV
ncbi:hypothetical protein BDW02DRAFT_561033 [Decorospora gaudefroyi]|uniref:Cyanovirin-N domain-containing protein n=1 Tax=Decorospora gaudefroyi TaxID=184978 RepID=A0A6A5K466_9PLEO|nr:hypothetical protein BDW02DRAFT_561033 [Decorospora gaudefroyi]